MTSATAGFRLQRINGSIGAEISEVDLSQPLTPETVAALRAALLDHVLLVFRGQHISREDLVRFGRYFGPLVKPAFQTNYDPSAPPEVIVLEQSSSNENDGLNNVFHRDGSFLAVPPMGLILHCVEAPSFGGDTVFSSMYAAYDALSPAMKLFLDGLTAEFSLASMIEKTKNLAYLSKRGSMEEIPPVKHPVVLVHPETGRKTLNVDRHYAVAIPELKPAEQRIILDFLFNHIEAAPFQCRVRWEPGTLTIVDNRAAVHSAIFDFNERRVINRLMVDDVVEPAEASA